MSAVDYSNKSFAAHHDNSSPYHNYTFPPSSSSANYYSRLERLLQNRSVSDEIFNLLMFGYSILAITGFLGNGLVCAVVIWKPYMRSVRNMLILNLAISDLLLCVFTMPFSLIQIVTRYWRLGLVLCKSVAGLQATSVFVSTLSITAIAIDRYKVIVHPTNNAIKMFGVLLVIFMIWLFSLLLATPLFIFRHVEKFYLNISVLPTVTFCSELWPIEKGAAIYSVCTMVFQYVVPIVSVSITHALICMKLQYRIVRKRTQANRKGRKKHESKRKRTNHLLLAIACVFAITWLPLNIVNLLADFGMMTSDRNKFFMIFGICHMFGMTSACSNPIFYGWFNVNFRREFKNIFKMCTKYRRKCETEETGTNVAVLQSETGHKVTYLQSEL